MGIEINFEFELAFRLALSFIIGTLIGLEREYNGKPAGLRTIIMICLGSTIFTEISLSIDSESRDRIASNIITGIGFLGAGVIFKDGLTINGITTATTIWISAALGMAVGAGEYFVATIGSFCVLIVLIFLERLKRYITVTHQVRTYKIYCDKKGELDRMIEGEMKRLNLDFFRMRDIMDEKHRHLVYEVSGREETLDKLNDYFRKEVFVAGYEY